MTDDSKYEYLLKYIVIGDLLVGKTSLLLKYTDNIDLEKRKTICVINGYKVMTHSVDGKKIKTTIFDTGGQERFKNLRASYYRGSSGVMLVYDITSLESFNNISHWIMQLEEYCPENVYSILIGNKCDLENLRQVSYDQGKQFADKYGMKFIETSIKNSTNVNNAFTTMTTDIVNIKNKQKESDNIDNNKDNNKTAIKIADKNKYTKTGSGKCCGCN